MTKDSKPGKKEAHPAISEDGKITMFSQNREKPEDRAPEMSLDLSADSVLLSKSTSKGLCGCFSHRKALMQTADSLKPPSDQRSWSICP